MEKTRGELGWGWLEVCIERRDFEVRVRGFLHDIGGEDASGRARSVRFDSLRDLAPEIAFSALEVRVQLVMSGSERVRDVKK